MSIKSNCYLILSLITAIVILTACFNQKTTVNKMYDVLENVVDSEKVFEEQQEPLVTLEKNEKNIYDQIIGLGMKQYEQIVKLSDQASKMADERKVHMEQETISIKKSEKEFRKVANYKEDFEDPALKKLANELYDVMMKRYNTHDVLNKEYAEGIKNDKELYVMFKNKNLPLGDLEAQVTKVNKTYEKIFAANESFNNLTEQYNEKKLAFYQKAGLKMKK
ncbi:MAG TPA: YkyA family protein [Neobacillus sp.]